MLRGDLVTALDWKPKKGEESGQYSWRMDNTWFVVQYGPGFSNTFLVTEYDDAGLQLLLQHEVKEETDAQNRTVQP